ncbi:D-lactate dehydrogenase [Flavobacterium glycines]|uniref:D-lactate dehydrogenase n=1 Tax=Flavobacterium glycines TaxID=551990 RepID=A0A1B9DWV4_9FLAO|nr:2-hydroxyacid dehydrogenase [Flavobacterium glycines]OCB74170.1 hydroxyacid dehydrogenase [Flavobacterium glycines]GEL09594.1 D-lactate dehydrogenase [Flavobacterium glycines]SDJ01056.1 D-lactate dehydrogenase [Flavobacterium glycines]
MKYPLLPLKPKVAFFSTQVYDSVFFEKYNADFGYELDFFDIQLNEQTVKLISNAEVVCVFVNDVVNESVIRQLAEKKVQIIALRCAGFNNVDLEAAKKYNLKVCRVPAYSPQAVAEHAMAMILTLNRKTHKAYNRVREQNFSLNGLLGFDLYGKTVGVIGTGNIGKAFAKIVNGFGCKVLAFDIVTDSEMEKAGVTFVSLETIFKESDIISLHCPLNEKTKYLINKDTISMMKNNVMLINTSRGALIETSDVIHALKKGKIAYLGIDVYEQEEKLFFKDHSEDIIQDDVIQRLMSFPNVLVTAHQAFFTNEALSQIALVTLGNIQELLHDNILTNKQALLI